MMLLRNAEENINSKAVRKVIPEISFIVFMLFYTYETWKFGSSSYFYMDDYIGIQSTANPIIFAFTPYNGHISFSGGGSWLLFLEIVGTQSYKPFLIFSIFLTLLASFLFYIVLKKVSNSYLALATATLCLFSSGSFHNQLWDQASLAYLAISAIFGILLLGQNSKKTMVMSITFVILGFGIGGLGFGVLAGWLTINAFQRKWIIFFISLGFAATMVLISVLSLNKSTNQSTGITENIFGIPKYLFVAVRETFRIGFGLPISPFNNYVAIVFISLILFSLVIIFKKYKNSILQNSFLMSLAALSTTWFLAALVRGNLDEVAAPRYLGVTEPLLFLLCISSVIIIYKKYSATIIQEKRKITASLTTFFLVTVSFISVFLQFPSWHQTRLNSSYLGSQNMGSLAAMWDSKEWIDPSFTPKNEGLNYVVQSKINNGWENHGIPNSTITSSNTLLFPEVFNDAYISTLFDAGLLVRKSGNKSNTNELCNSSIIVVSGQNFSIFNTSPETKITVKTSDGYHDYNYQQISLDGVYSFQKVNEFQEWDVSIDIGCLA